MITARAYTNIALIKYWGKRDKTLFLPYTSSLSMTLDAFYTDTSVSFIDSESDIFYLNGQLQNQEATDKLTKFINLFRERSQDERSLRVDSINHVPTAAGLASSASAYAALSTALNELYHLNLSKEELSRLSRRGSGSSTRSLFGGFVEWQKGTDDKTSYAYSLLPKDEVPIGMIVCLINSGEKTISSRDGMELTVQTSPFFEGFVEASAIDLEEMKQAIATQDVNQIGAIAERNALRMHATMLGANPPFTYFEPKSIETIQFIQNLRKEGFHCYITMDAGPNVKIIAPKEEIIEIKHRLQSLFDESSLITAYAGDESYIIEKERDQYESKCSR